MEATALAEQVSTWLPTQQSSQGGGFLNRLGQNSPTSRSHTLMLEANRGRKPAYYIASHMAKLLYSGALEVSLAKS